MTEVFFSCDWSADKFVLLMQMDALDVIISLVGGVKVVVEFNCRSDTELECLGQGPNIF